MSKLPFTFAEPEQPQATFADLAREFAWDIASGLCALAGAGGILAAVYVIADALGAFQ